MGYIDTSALYHIIRAQSVIKLYVVYNMLEVGMYNSNYFIWWMELMLWIKIAVAVGPTMIMHRIINFTVIANIRKLDNRMATFIICLATYS